MRPVYNRYVCFYAYEAPDQCDRSPPAEPMRHFKRVVVASAEFRIGKDDHPTQKGEDEVGEDQGWNGNL